MSKTKFVTSYSGGKDSMLALYRSIKAGMEPVSLLIMHNEARRRSWFHGITEAGLREVSGALGIPINLVRTGGEEYAANFEKALAKAKENGAEACVFGDIDIQGHFDWCTARCEAVGIKAVFPLWGQSRRGLVDEVIDSGFKARITVVDTKRLSGDCLGKTLTHELVDDIEAHGADACGENGEYHTFVYDGPLFSRPAALRFGEPIMENDYAILPVAD